MADLPQAPPAPASRVLYLDNLKVALIALIIAIHAVLGYTDTGFWSYGDAREVTLSPVTTGVLTALVGPFGLFVIPLLFLVAGLLTPASLERKGAARFAKDRLLRLGVPFVVYVVVIQPPVVYPVDHRWGNASGSYWSEFLGADDQPDTGPLWFVGVLLLYSLAYAAWSAVRPARPGPRRPTAITSRHLGLASAAIVLPTFLVRLAWPVGGESFMDLNLWEWPACIALFGLGVVAARQGWTAVVPRELRRQCGRNAAVAAVALLVVSGTVMGPLGLDGDVLLGGPHAASLTFIACEAVLAVSGAVWMLGVAQHFDRPYRWTASLGRTAYGAFIVQTPVLLAGAVALRPLGVPAEVKALVLLAVSVPAAFGLTALLLRGVRPLRRLL